MSDTIKQFVREQMTATVAEYHTRVWRLAFTYSAIVVTCAVTIVLILIKGKFFVTLAQRSNVETLTLALVLLLFGYLGVISLPGAVGTVKIVWYNAPRWFGGDPHAVERAKQKALKWGRTEDDSVFLNCLVFKQGQPEEPIVLPLADEAGSLGIIRIDGARLVHEEAPHHSSNSIFGFFEQRLQQLVRKRHPGAAVQIIQWTTIDDDTALQYAGFVEFSRNLSRHLNTPPLWPSHELTADDIATLCDDARRLCPSLRNEAHLPDVEFEAEHRLPIIPEPLGIISLSRSERRADPLASMGCALIITLIILGFVVLFVLMPPWVPGI